MSFDPAQAFGFMLIGFGLACGLFLLLLRPRRERGSRLGLLGGEDEIIVELTTFTIGREASRLRSQIRKAQGLCWDGFKDFDVSQQEGGRLHLRCPHDDREMSIKIPPGSLKWSLDDFSEHILQPEMLFFMNYEAPMGA